MHNDMIKPLHPWNVSVEEAIQIQEALKNRIILKKTFLKVKAVGVMSPIPKMGIFSSVPSSSSHSQIWKSSIWPRLMGQIPFSYIPTLLTFREGPILIKTFQRLKIKPDIMIFDGQGIAHPRGMGLASHMGLWLNLPSIGCAKTALLDEFISQDLQKEVMNGFEGKGKKWVLFLERKRR